MNILVVAFSSFILSWLIVGMVCKYAKHVGLMSEVNARSSHQIPKPHGGGIGFIISATLVGLVLAVGGDAFLWKLISLALIIALLGLFDDLYSVPALLRLFIQIGVSCFLILSYTSPPIPIFFQGVMYAEWVFVVGLILTTVWWINLFNFMDGVDGIASMQGIYMVLAGVGLSFWVEPASINAEESIWLICVAASTLGFLFHNWSPAKIFMGDIGSTWLAFIVFSFALYSVEMSWLNYSVWLILAAVFVTDATVTLIRRMAMRMKWYEAHRSHAYQRLARRWGDHTRVVVIYSSINVLWLFPLAATSVLKPEWQAASLMLAYIPLVLLAITLGAGQKDL